jgi:Domain of unknown function (DUF4296)
MRMLICIVVISFIWIACSDSNAIPKNIIDRDKMEKILWDIIQADQYSNQYLKKDSSRINVKMETMKLYDQIFLIHHVSRESFKKSYDFYIEHPDITKPIFDSLSARASKQRNESYRHLSKPLPPVQTKLQAK